MNRGMRCAAFVLSLGLLLVGLTSVPSEAGPVSSQRTGISAQHPSADGARVKKKHHKKKHHKKKHKKKHKRAKTKRTSIQRCWPGIPAATSSRISGRVLLRWTGTTCTSRYRVHISAGWWGSWPGGGLYTPWISSSNRSTTYRPPTQPKAGDNMIAVQYGNPIFAQVEANNAYNTRRTATHKSRWIATWAGAPKPASGAPIRFGNYNVMLAPTGTRAAAVARNIGAHGVTMAALQEATQTTAAQVASTLTSVYAGTWGYVKANGANSHDPAQQILYRTDLFTLKSSGLISKANPRDSAHPVKAPWASFQAKSGSRTFYVASVHIPASSGSKLVQNRATGAAAQVVVNYMKSLTSAPVIVAGDLRYGREPWGEYPGYVPAQPTFVRNGYYDAEASQSMHGQNYSIVNSVNGRPSAHQRPHASGAGPRSDHILMRGIVGSKTYYNVVNWSYRGLVPSDHNLIFSDIMIPN